MHRINPTFFLALFFAITLFVQKNERVNKFVLSPTRLCMLVIQPEESQLGGEKTLGNGRKLPLSCSLSFPFRLLKAPQRKTC